MFRSLIPDEAGVRNGCLLFLLEKKHMLRTDVIAETVLPLEEFPSVDTTAAKNIKIKSLYMNIPKKEEGI